MFKKVDVPVSAMKIIRPFKYECTQYTNVTEFLKDPGHRAEYGALYLSKLQS